MKKDRAKQELLSLIQAEINDMDKLSAELRECAEDTPILRRAKGSILHDFYNACERIFETIAREINGGVPLSGQWHKKLLYQMTLPIEGIRPAVISAKLAARLDEFLAFRHLFRNIYGFELAGERLAQLADKFPETVELFKKEIAGFIKKIVN